MSVDKNYSFLGFNEGEAERICDALSSDDKFWKILREGFTGKMTAQELGYELMVCAEIMEEYIREQSGDNADRDMGDMMRKEYEEHA